jgi:hypothetical protein
MDYQQEYIKHEYIELKMPAGQDGEGKSTFLLDPHHLHIWPRHSFMLIALPNKVTRFAVMLRRHSRYGDCRIKLLLALCLHQVQTLIASVAPTVFWVGLKPIFQTHYI